MRLADRSLRLTLSEHVRVAKSRISDYLTFVGFNNSTGRVVADVYMRRDTQVIEGPRREWRDSWER